MPKLAFSPVQGPSYCGPPIVWPATPMPTLLSSKGTIGKEQSQIEKKSEPAQKRVWSSPQIVGRTVPKWLEQWAHGGSPSLYQELMDGMRTDWSRLRQAAARIMDANYNCIEFVEDVIGAIPEFALYLAGSDTETTTSGRTRSVELQRTIGALCAVYWLMRLPFDGAQSFCFGIDDSGKPLHKESPEPVRTSEERHRRESFLQNFDWGRVTQLLFDAGLIHSEAGENSPPDVPRTPRHDVERTVALIVLTAIHDIMKNPCLLPEVAPEHHGWGGYVTGDIIFDHDVALGYVLQHLQFVLPSFCGLPTHQQESIQFTQSKMEYNMGWLVQAEAPPIALFGHFKKLLETGSVCQQDVAFYFVHWLTDLSGAEPYPKEGCEKFVLKFPMMVLNAFMNSMGIVQELIFKSETQVMEDYLIWRWTSHDPPLGPPPLGPGGIAQMRLVLMSQGNAARVLDAYHNLDDSDKDVLAVEMALTGSNAQIYSCEPPGVQCPAILVYYGPALMQKAGAEDPMATLRALAAVYRTARRMFPLSPNPEGSVDTVIVRIDAMKELNLLEMLDCSNQEDIWTMRRLSSREAEVKRLCSGGSPRISSSLTKSETDFLLLHLGSKCSL